jgi:predicted nucleic acid-binding protein
LIVVDSSGWLEFFMRGPLARQYAPYLTDRSDIVLPTVFLLEVYKILKREISETEALGAVQSMLDHATIADLTSDLAFLAGDACLDHGLAMADAIIYATARHHEAELITSDHHFQTLPNVTYLPKGVA